MNIYMVSLHHFNPHQQAKGCNNQARYIVSGADSSDQAVSRATSSALRNRDVTCVVAANVWPVSIAYAKVATHMADVADTLMTVPLTR